MTAGTTLDVLPACSTHGQMTLRPTAQQTKEQVWCGTWYDCSHHSCRSSVLLPSPELTAQLAEQEAGTWQASLLTPAAPRG